MKISSRCVLYVVGLIVLMTSLSQASEAEEAMSYKLVKKFRQELYSESTYYQKYDVVTESRLRSYISIWQDEHWELRPYLGVSLQYQTPGAQNKYFDNTLHPALGVQMTYLRKIALSLQGGVRTNLSQTEKQSEWDPRAVLSFGDFWSWVPVKLPGVFTEIYAESAYLPRLSSTPVSTLWLKQGYRMNLISHLYLDPYAELFLRESRSADLGPSLTQGRGGARLLWVNDSWSVAGLIYHNFRQDESSASTEGLLVVGGNF